MKTKILYDRWNPNQEGVTHVVIQTENQPPYVFGTYVGKDQVPCIGKTMVEMHVDAANKLFDFYKGDMSEVKSD